MPVPITPVNVPRRDGDRQAELPPDYIGINYELLQGIVQENKAKSQVKVSDSDAGLLFKFWQNSQEVGDSVKVPHEFTNNDVLRLKALGFVAGDDTKIVRFTERGREVIKNIVLSEENAFVSTRVHKPYEEILADRQKSKGHVRLALEKKK
jgi:hypothetical protein